ncbi:MAG: hypothetical protein JXB34_05230 [Bacteroidales bacterium]|nr:hypothetical protein [Bacteroidales bacterium]
MDAKPETFSSNGTILLTGEYLVLFGARVLAFPVRYGQKMTIREQNINSILAWRAYEPNGLWFNVDFSLPNLSIIDTCSMEKAMYLQKVLLQLEKLTPGFFNRPSGLAIDTLADFPVQWGMGTRSTLITNLASWAGIDALALHHAVSKGSGYDVACATACTPVVYQLPSSGKPLVASITFNKLFTGNMYLVYSGRKNSTEQQIIQFLQRHRGMKSEIKRISKITDKIIEETSLEKFIDLLMEHERVIGAVLDEPPVQFKNFVSFKGVVKSLGPWESDFVLAVTTESPGYVYKYFEQFGLTTVLLFKNTVYTG